MQRYFRRLFPTYGVYNVALYYALTALHNTWFQAGNWLFLWLRYMTVGQLGLYDAMAFGFSMLLEIPSGAVADLIGQRKTIIVSFVLSATGALGMAIGTSAWHIVGAFFIFMAGMAFYSGALEAHTYESLKEHGHETEFDTVIGSGQQIALFATVAAAAAGGLLYVVHPRLPFFGLASGNLIGLVVACFLRENRQTRPQNFSLAAYTKQLRSGFHELILIDIRPFLLMFAILLGVFEIYDDGFVRPYIAAQFGFDGQLQSYLFAASGLIAAFSARQLPRIRKVIPDRLGINALLALMGVAFLLATFARTILAGLFILFAISIAGNLSFPWISVIVNRVSQSENRATTLSTLAFFAKLPYVLGGAAIGWLADTHRFWIFTLCVAMVALLTSFKHVRLPKRKAAVLPSATLAEIEGHGSMVKL